LAYTFPGKLSSYTLNLKLQEKILLAEHCKKIEDNIGMFCKCYHVKNFKSKENQLKNFTNYKKKFYLRNIVKKIVDNIGMFCKC